MKVVQIATTTAGGAGIAARRLNASLNLAGIESKLITGTAYAKEGAPNEIAINKGFIKRLLSRSITFLQSRIIQNDKFLMTSISLPVLSVSQVQKENPDVIHIHSAYNFVNSRTILDFCRLGIPIFLTLHDERFFTGGCHYSFSCEGYRSGCTQCPFVRKGFKSLTSKELAGIVGGYGQVTNLSIIAPSEWIYKRAQESIALSNSAMIKVFNSIDDSYAQEYPIEKSPRSEYVVSFVAQDLFSIYKGLGTLLECINTYEKEFKEQNIKFQFVGKGDKIEAGDLLYKQLAKLNELELREVYLDSDLLIVPSSIDNSPNVIFEALACGVPFVGSNRGGVPELCQIFGMEIFEYGNASSMFSAIVAQKSKPNDPYSLRKKALSFTHPSVVATQHIEAYKSKLISAP
jgi:glycosyltransferase involved in cell wall biosynthesis